MTIASQTSRITYTGDGSTVAFAVPFYFLNNSDLVVYLRDTTGAQTLQVQGSHYNLAGATLASGTCTFLVAPPTGYRVVIYRDPPIVQTASYNNNDPFAAKSHETALDQGVIISQRLNDRLARTPELAASDINGSGAYTAQNNRINNLASATGTNDAVNLGQLQAVQNALTAAFGSAGAAAYVYATKTAAAIASVGSTITFIQTQGYTTVGDGGATTYIKLGAPPNPVKPWHFQSADGAWWQIASGRKVSPISFGCVEDQAVNNTANMQAAIDFINLAGGGVLDLGSRTFRVDTQLNLCSKLVIENGTLNFTNAALSAHLLSAFGSLGSSTAFTSATVGDSTFVVSSAAGIAVDDWLFLSSSDQFGSDGTKRGEWVQVQTIVGTTITPYGMLLDTYTTTPVFYKPTLLTDITLRNLHLIGRGTTYAQIAAQIYLCRGVRVENIRSEWFADQHIQFNRSLDCTVNGGTYSHADAVGTAYGICVVDGCHRISVESANFSDFSHGTTMGGADGVCRFLSVTDCDISDTRDAGIDFHSQSQFITVSGNTIGANSTRTPFIYDGIMCEGANATITGNTISNFRRAGIFAQNLTLAASVTANAHVISGNTISNALGAGPVYGIYAQHQGTVADWRLAISGNAISVEAPTTSTGILVEVHSAGTTISGVSITGNTVYSRLAAVKLSTAATKIMHKITITGNALETFDTVTDSVIELSAGSTPNFMERAIIAGNSMYGGKYGIDNTGATRVKADANMIQGFGTLVTNGTALVGTSDNYSV